MAWNLKAHILDHSAATSNKLPATFDENNPKNQHFTASIDISQLIVNHKCKSQADIDKVMTAFMNDLVNHTHTFEESKGRDKHGKQLRRTKNFDFKDALVAYHNSGSDSINSNNYSVEPHFHILFDKSKKLGIGYHQLKKAINTVSEKYDLVFNFQEEVENKNNSLKLSTSGFTWFTKKVNNKDFIAKVSNKEKLTQEINSVVQHYKNTGNIQYYCKAMIDFQSRLKRLNLDFEYQGKNLKDEFPLFLTDKDIATLKALHNSDKDKIYEFLSDRSNKIARAYIESKYGFNNIVFNELQKRGVVLPHIDLDLEHINLIIGYKQKSLNDYKLSINQCYVNDYNQVLTIAKNEKEVQQLMQKLGYKSFAYKQKTISNKRQRVGFTFTNKNNKQVTVYYSKLGLNLKDIRAQLIKNNKNINNSKVDTLVSHLNNYKPRKQNKSNEKYLQIYKIDSSLDLSNFYIKEVDNHIEFKAKGTFIVDNGNELIIKRQKYNVENNVKLLLDMAQAKGWNKIKISGTPEFKQAIKKELEARAKANQELKNKLIQNTNKDTPAVRFLKESKSDLEHLEELKNIHLSNYSLDEKEAEYTLLWEIRERAVKNKDIDMLDKSYEADKQLSHEEIRYKIIEYAKVLNISSSDINTNIANKHFGIDKQEAQHWHDTVKNDEYYDELFLNEMVDELENKMTSFYFRNELTDNQVEKNIKTMDSNLEQFKYYRDEYINKKIYQEKLQDIKEYMSSSSFYIAQHMINELDNETDKKQLNNEYSEHINAASEDEKIFDKVEKNNKESEDLNYKTSKLSDELYKEAEQSKTETKGMKQ